MAISKIESAALASGVPSRSQLPAGTVLQVVHYNPIFSTQYTTSSSYVSTGFGLSITPTSATSKILVTVASVMTNTYQQSTYLTLYRTINGSQTDIGNGAALATYYNNSASTYTWVPAVINFLDTPATTSSVNYTVYLKGASGQTAYFADSNSRSTITLMEIAA